MQCQCCKTRLTTTATLVKAIEEIRRGSSNEKTVESELEKRLNELERKCEEKDAELKMWQRIVIERFEYIQERLDEVQNTRSLQALTNHSLERSSRSSTTTTVFEALEQLRSGSSLQDETQNEMKSLKENLRELEMNSETTRTELKDLKSAVTDTTSDSMQSNQEKLEYLMNLPYSTDYHLEDPGVLELEMQIPEWTDCCSKTLCREDEKTFIVDLQQAADVYFRKEWELRLLRSTGFGFLCLPLLLPLKWNQRVLFIQFNRKRESELVMMYLWLPSSLALNRSLGLGKIHIVFNLEVHLNGMRLCKSAYRMLPMSLSMKRTLNCSFHQNLLSQQAEILPTLIMELLEVHEEESGEECR